jgi:hypothetical protein
MKGRVEPPLAPALGALAVARVLGDVGEQTGLEDALPMVRRIKAAIEIARGPSAVSPDLCRHFFPRLEALGQQHPICFIARSHGHRRSDIPSVVEDRAAFVPRLVCIP